MDDRTGFGYDANRIVRRVQDDADIRGVAIQDRKVEGRRRWPYCPSFTPLGESARRLPFNSPVHEADGNLWSRNLTYFSNHWQLQRLVRRRGNDGATRRTSAAPSAGSAATTQPCCRSAGQRLACLCQAEPNGKHGVQTRHGEHLGDLWRREDRQPSAGAGETPIIAIGPAVGSAIFDACGIHLRSMPMIPNGLKEAAGRTG